MPVIRRKSELKKNKSVRLKESDLNNLKLVAMMHNKTEQQIMEKAIIDSIKNLEKEYTDKVMNRKVAN